MKRKDTSYYLEAGDIGTAVDGVTHGLCWIRMKNNSMDFYLFPSCTFSGAAAFWDKEGNAVLEQYYDGAAEASFEENFLTVHAVDGTVVKTELGYCCPSDFWV